ncbi:unnamed protein product [Aspergillus oryzae]|nr:unnamed protein product [Aspergillus oryzae]
MDGTNVLLENIVVSAKLSKQPDGEYWAQNTDGLDTDTMDVNHVQVTNFTYTGGDDCIALKPRSYNVTVTGATCNGGNGIPIGSIGEYLEDSSVKDVYMSDLKVSRALGVVARKVHLTLSTGPWNTMVDQNNGGEFVDRGHQQIDNLGYPP